MGIRTIEDYKEWLEANREKLYAMAKPLEEVTEEWLEGASDKPSDKQ